jgi:cell wall-associated NlpC family hydrolase
MTAIKLFTFLLLLTTSLVFSQTSIKHKVTKGESIYAIAKKYDVKQAAIYKLNPKVKGKLLQLKTILLIPNNQVNAEENEISTSNHDLSQAQNHTVVSGETLSRISKKYRTTIQELERLNPAVIHKLPIGYSLIIREEEEPPTLEAIKKEFGANAIVENTEEVVLEPSRIELLIETASKNLGTRYRRGGTSFKGFDCSGLIFTTFKEIDFTLPRSSSQQAKIGTKIQQSQAQKGDLIFFATNGRGSINHVGMITEIIGDEIKFIHSSVHLGVIISSIKEAYYSKRFKQINRVLGIMDKD